MWLQKLFHYHKTPTKADKHHRKTKTLNPISKQLHNPAHNKEQAPAEPQTQLQPLPVRRTSQTRSSTRLDNSTRHAFSGR